MKKYYPLTELAEMALDGYPKTVRGLQQRAYREGWPFVEVDSKGGKNGKRCEYAPPPRMAVQIREREIRRVVETPPVEQLPCDLPTMPVQEVADPSQTTKVQQQQSDARKAVLDKVEVLAALGGTRDCAIKTLLDQAGYPENVQFFGDAAGRHGAAHRPECYAAG